LKFTPLVRKLIKRAADMALDRDKISIPSVASFPTELLRQVASWISVGKDLISWLNACEGCGVIAKLPEIVAHYKVALRRTLSVNAIIDRHARYVICKVSCFYSRIEFGMRYLSTLISLELSKKPNISLNLSKFDMGRCYMLCDQVFLNGC
jgi:hypothetical protein